MMKIASLIPSSTEMLHYLGLDHLIVGVSHECDFPESVKKLPKLTNSNIKNKQISRDIDKDINQIIKNGLSVYEVDEKKLKALSPDIIITQSQCSVCAVSINDVRKSLKTWLNKTPEILDLKPNNFKDVMNDILLVGKKFGKLTEAKILIKKINSIIRTNKKLLLKSKIKNILCIEWLDPIMIAGNWIPDLLSFVNASSILSKSGAHSKFFDLEDIPLDKIDLVIYMPCGYDISKTKFEIMNSSSNLFNLFKTKMQFIVDGNRYFNRPGPGLLESTKILGEIIHPNFFEPNPSYNRWIQIN